MNTFLDNLKNQTNVAYTENGARAFATTGTKVLDFFSQGGALREAGADRAINIFSQAWSENNELALKTMFYFRDIRGGQGQRGAFRAQLEYLAKISPETVKKNLALIAEYGRWDDLYSLFDVDKGDKTIDLTLREAVVETFKNQLIQDIEAFRSGENVSLLAKWLKSENASSKETKRLGYLTRIGLGFSPKMYRKTLSQLRKHLDVVERKVSADKWDDINYEHVPSNAMMKYRKAFDKHDHQRFETFIGKVNAGEAKINVSVTYPYEIVEKVRSREIQASVAQAMWDNLPDYVEGSDENSLAVVDTSGSMWGQPINVALSIGLYLAERARGPYKDHFITFSNRPALQEVVGSTIVEKIQNMQNAHWDMNTNIEAVFMLILNTAVKNSVAQEDMIKRLYIISDMEFDNCTRSSNRGGVDETLFQTIKHFYGEAGYEMPALVFWNVNARNVQFPMKADERGFVNVSGFSPSIFKTLMTGESTSPEELMLEVLGSERYAPLKV